MKSKPYNDLNPMSEEMNIKPGIDNNKQKNKIIINSLMDEFYNIEIDKIYKKLRNSESSK